MLIALICDVYFANFAIGFGYDARIALKYHRSTF